MRARSRWTPLVIGLLSCSKPEEKAPPATTLPPTTVGGLPNIPFEDTGTWDPQDTGGTITNIAPDSTVRILQEGEWTMSPSGGPYEEISGTLVVNEYPDGEIDTGTDTAVDTAEPPQCEVVFSVSGTLIEAPACPECDVEFEITWTLVEGDPAPCRDPDLPVDGAQWRIGYSSSRDAIAWDYYVSGVWVDWYTTRQFGDLLRVEYDTTKAVTVEEEE